MSPPDTEESIEASVKAGIVLGAEVWTKQYEKVSTTTTKTATVPVIPGYEGWLDAGCRRSPCPNVTDGIHFQVTNFRLTYPGYGQGDLWSRPHALQPTAGRPAARNDRATHCDHLPAIVVPPGAFQLARPEPPATILVCVSGHQRCKSRVIAGGTGLALRRDERIALARGSRIYATGTVRRGRIVVRAQRRLRAGGYSMLVSGPTRSSMFSVTLR